MRTAPLNTAHDELRRRCPVAAEIVGQSRRSDAQLARARLLLLLHETAAPFGVALRVGWYVPGAVARVNASSLRRLWQKRYGAAPDVRTIRRHLDWAESSCLLVRAPGDPHPFGRHPDTLHLVRNEHERRWWQRRGRRRLEDCSDARRLLRVWQRVFGGWRERVRAVAARLARWMQPLRGAQRRDLSALRSTVLDASPWRIIGALRAAGVHVSRPWLHRLTAQGERLRAAAAHLLQRVDRLGWPRNPAGWLVWSWRAGGSAPSQALHRLVRQREAEPRPFDVLGSLGLRDVLRLAPAATPADLLAVSFGRI